jgi:magnesium transporter
MIRVFYLNEAQEIKWVKLNNPETEIQDFQNVIWIDLQSPSEQEKRTVEELYGIEFFTPQEAAEIESSSRYYEDQRVIEANNTFVVYENKFYVARQVSFILKNGILFTLRNNDFKAFADVVRRLKTMSPGYITRGTQIWMMILETRIDLDADFIEYLSRVTNHISKKIIRDKEYQEEILLKLTELQENTILIRESIIDKQRVVSSLLKSTMIPDEEKERLRIVIKDINSLLQHADFSFQRLEYLQNTFLGLVNIEQNHVIKIFTVVTVVFMPPTLIASIYGMNFEFMPEIKWTYGYPFSLGLMLVSSLVFLWYFKRKKWL